MKGPISGTTRTKLNPIFRSAGVFPLQRWINSAAETTQEPPKH
jgi:hypothetical protein